MTDETMIDKICTALAPHLDERTTMMEAAQDVLSAMREPTEAMIGAGSDVVDDLLPFWAKMAWLAMIDAALGEEPKA